MADAAAPPNLMGYLFARDVMTQSLRLGLAGAWSHGHPELVEALSLLDEQCPTLVKGFLPIGEQEGVDDGSAEGFNSIEVDDEHRFGQVFMRGFQLDRHFGIKASTNLMKLDPQYRFIQHLMTAYRTDYGIRVLDFGPQHLKWYQRIAYTDP